MIFFFFGHSVLLLDVVHKWMEMWRQRFRFCFWQLFVRLISAAQEVMHFMFAFLFWPHKSRAGCSIKSHPDVPCILTFCFILNKKVKKVKQCLNIPWTTASKNVLLWWTRIIQRNNIGNFKDVEQWIRSWLTWPETQDGNRCWTVNTDTRDRFTKPTTSS